MAELRVSELPTAASLDDSDLLLLSQVDENSQTGYASAKTTNVALATKIAKQTNFSDLQTTSKTIIGAINEISGAASSLVDLDDVDITTPADGECLQYDGTSQKWENKDILAVNETTLTEPYVYKQVPNGKYTEKLKKLIGASVVWNQLAKADKPTTTTHGVTFTNNGDGSWTLTGTPDNDNTFYNLTTPQNGDLTIKPNHVYYMSAKSNTNWVGFSVQSDNASGFQTAYVYTSDIIYKASNFTVVENTKTWARLQVSNYANVNIGTVKVTPQIFDLTAMFGSTIADYVNTLETAQVGSGIAWLKSYGFFTEEYHAYSANTIQSVSVSSHITKDSNDQTLTTTNLDHTTLRGIFKLDANNNLYADGDIYNADGSGSVKYAVVDLGSLNWELNSTSKFVTSGSIGTKQLPNQTTLANILCSNYPTVTQATISSNDKSICGLNWGDGRVLIYDTTYTDATAFKTAMSGVYLVYELATPTTASLTPFNPLSTIEQGGTEEFVDYGVSQGNRDVAIPCGNESVYGDNRLMAQIIKYINN